MKLLSLVAVAGATLLDDVVTYTSLGERGHRSGSDEDLDTQFWLETRISELGLQAEDQPVPITNYYRFDFCTMVLGNSTGGPVDSYPSWVPAKAAVERETMFATPEEIASGNVRDRAVLLEITGRGVDDVFYDRSKTLGALGATLIVAWSKGVEGQNPPADQVVALDFDASVYGWVRQAVPIQIVSAETAFAITDSETPSVSQAACEGFHEGPKESDNIHVTLNPNAPSGRHVVVTTPFTSWFQAAGERGPGVAMLLALMEETAARAPSVTYHMVFTTGHELGYLGAVENINFLASKGVTPENTVAWLHFGSSITTTSGLGAAGFGGPGGSEIGAVVTPILQNAGFATAELNPADTPGELGVVLRAGFTAFGVSGEHPEYHTQADSVDTVNDEELFPAYRALADALFAVEAEVLTKE